MYDFNWGNIWSHDRQNGGCHQRSAGFCGGCGVTVYYNDWCDGAVGRSDGDCAEIRVDCQDDQGNTAFYQFSVSKDSQRASCQGIYFYQFDCQCTWAWLGVYVSADGTAKGGVETVDGKKGKQGRVASNEMCTFLILNISSLQLIPVNMIAYRSQYGSVNPAGIIAPAIVATAVSTGVAVVYCKMKNRKGYR